MFLRHCIRQTHLLNLIEKADIKGNMNIKKIAFGHVDIYSTIPKFIRTVLGDTT